MTKKSKAFLELDGLTKAFGDFFAVRDVKLQIVEGEFFTLVGPSGSGKTTLLDLFLGLIKSNQGQILFNDK